MRLGHKSGRSQENGSSITHYAPLQPIKRLNAPPSAAGGQTSDLLSGELLDEAASTTTLATQVTPSVKNPQASLPNSEQLNALNPFAGSASFSANSSHQALPSVTVRNGVLGSSKMYSYESYQPSQDYQGTGRLNSGGYKAPWAVAGSVQSPELPPQDQDSMSQPQQSRSSHLAMSPAPDGEKFLVGPNSSSRSPVIERKTVSSLPPPPILYTERERFFEKKRQMIQSPQPASVTPTRSLEQRTSNLTLQSTGQKQDAPTGKLAQLDSSFRAKQVSPLKKETSSADRLFEDLVDLRTMGANFKTAGFTSSLSQPNTGRTSGM